jgi:site-specific recombinase XerD
MTYSAIVEALHRAERAAGLPLWSPHTLKHTFCTHLAILGSAPVTLKELAAHKHLSTMMRYTHMISGALQEAIRLLDRPASRVAVGDILETEERAI